MNRIQTVTENRFAAMFADPQSKDARMMISNLTDLMMQVRQDDAQGAENLRRADAVDTAFAELDKDARLSVRRQVRAEFAQWVREYFDGLTDDQWADGDGHEQNVGRKFGIQYWNRIAAVAGI